MAREIKEYEPCLKGFITLAEETETETVKYNSPL